MCIRYVVKRKTGTLVGLPVYVVRRLLQKAAARLVFRLRRSDHITDALVSLHCLRVSERIIFKISVKTYRVLQGDARSTYGSSHRSPTFRLDKGCGFLQPTMCMFLLLDCLLLDVAPSFSPALAHGTNYLSMLPQHHLCSPSEDD